MSSKNYKIADQNALYFLTFTITEWIDVFTRLKYKIIIADSLKFCRENKGLNLYAWCLMTNHIHLVCKVDPPFKMSDFIRDFKKHTAKEILSEMQKAGESRRNWMLYRFKFAGKFDNRITNFRFWQDKSHPIELDSNEKMRRRINYIHQNPVKSGIVQNPEDYLFSSARNYADLSAVIEIDFI